AARTLGQFLQPSLGRHGDAPAARPLLEDCARRGPAGRAGARDAGGVAGNRSRASRRLALATPSRNARGNAMGWLGFLLGALVGAYAHGFSGLVAGAVVGTLAGLAWRRFEATGAALPRAEGALEKRLRDVERRLSALEATRADAGSASSAVA